MKKHWAFTGIIVLLLATALITETGSTTAKTDECGSSSCCSQKIKSCPAEEEDLMADPLPGNVSHQLLFIGGF